jgi:hypothetical protein
VGGAYFSSRGLPAEAAGGQLEAARRQPLPRDRSIGEKGGCVIGYFAGQAFLQECTERSQRSFPVACSFQLAARSLGWQPPPVARPKQS